MKTQKHYTLFHSQNVTYVLTPCPRTTKSQFRDSDFLKTGLALCGIARPFETLEEVTARFAETHLRNNPTIPEPVEVKPKKPAYIPTGKPRGVPKGSTKPQKNAIRWAHVDESMVGTSTVI